MKKAISFLLLIAFMAFAANAQTILKGDMNDDGSLDVSDVTSLVSAILGNSPLQWINVNEWVDPYAVDNSAVVGTWWKTKYESVTFNEDGTTTLEGADTYAYQPFVGRIVFYQSGSSVTMWNVLSLTEDSLDVNPIGTDAVVPYTKAVPIQYVTDITLDYTSLILQSDEVRRLTATVLPSDADNPAVVWSSSDESVAEVNQFGRIITNSLGSCVITCAATDGSGVTATCKVNVLKQIPDYVDLDLPSGTLWATFNIGAESPEDYGDYFAWGETEGYNKGKTYFWWTTYKWCNGDYDKLTKYCSNSSFGNGSFTDVLTELELEDDAAYVNWGPAWRMPSKEQLDELINSEYTTTEKTTLNGVNGWKITSKSNGNSIFLPAAGERGNSSLYNAGSGGQYHSRTLYLSDPCHAWYLLSIVINTHYGDRCYGQSVRPVRLSE